MSSHLIPTCPESDLFVVKEVSGRKYRILQSLEPTRVNHSGGMPSVDCFHELIVADGETAFDDSIDSGGITFDEASQEYVLTIPSSQAFFPFLAGKGGSTRKRLEEETGCKLVIPRQHDPSNDLGINSCTCAFLRSANLKVSASRSIGGGDSIASYSRCVTD